MAIVVFQHSDEGRPGRLGLTLRDHGWRLDIRRPDRGDAIPADYDAVDGVVTLGGPQSVTNAENAPDWMKRELEYLRGAHERELPVVGVCLGHQMVAVALGGEVERLPEPEVGFHTLSIKPAGQTDTVLAGHAWRSPQFQFHHDGVTALPEGAQAIASSERCKIQVFRAGIRTYGFQHHFEADKSLGVAIARAQPEALSAAGLSVADIEAQFDRHGHEFSRLASRLCVNLATFVFGAPGLATSRLETRTGWA